jgi:hypothetical protein
MGLSTLQAVSGWCAPAALRAGAARRLVFHPHHELPTAESTRLVSAGACSSGRVLEVGLRVDDHPRRTWPRFIVRGDILDELLARG